MAAATRPARDDSIHTSLWTKCRVQEEGNDKVEDQVPVDEGVLDNLHGHSQAAGGQRPSQKSNNEE